MEKKIVALLPMKAHSERVPNKNIRDFNGRPLYEWVLKALIYSENIIKIIINTDSPNILENVKTFPKVIAVSRPKELCGDFVAMNKIISHDISLVENKYFLQTHVTNPLLSTKTIDKAVSVFFDNLMHFDSLFSVVKHQSRFYRTDGVPINHNPKKMVRSQDNEAIYEENSNIFIFSRDSFEQNNRNRVGKKPYMFIMEKDESTDIDNEEDFILAEMLHCLNLKIMKSKKRKELNYE